MSRVLQVVFISCLVLGKDEAVALPPSARTPHYFQAGDINIGLLAEVTRSSASGECDAGLGGFGNPGYQRVEAFLFAIETINRDPDLLSNITLGSAVLDNCWRSLTGLKRTIQFLPGENEQDGTCLSPGGGDCTNTLGDHHLPVSAVVGLSTSAESVILSPLLSVYQIPHISGMATSDELSDKKRFEYFSRVIPPDRFMVEGMVEFLLKMNWSYLQVVHDDGSYGVFAVKQLTIQTKRLGLCIAQTIPVELMRVDRRISLSIMKKLRKFSSARVVVLILSSFDINQLLLVTRELGILGQFIFVASELAGRLSGPLSHGLFYMQHYFPYNTEFQDRYLKLNPYDNEENPWIKEIWRKHFQCQWGANTTNNSNVMGSVVPCENFDELGDGFDSGDISKYARYIIDAVLVIAKAIDSAIKNFCPEAFRDKSLLKTCATGPRLLAEIRSTNTSGLTGKLQFDEVGDNMGSYVIKQKHYDKRNGSSETMIGHWDKAISWLKLWEDRLNWEPYHASPVTADQDFDIPESLCSKPCAFREYRIQQELSCCWMCHKCRLDEILTENHTKCSRCPEFYWPDDINETKCVRIQPEHLVMTSSVSLAFQVWALAGVLVCAIIASVFVRYRKERLIKASSISLSFMILLGIALAFMSSLPLLTTPTSGTCTSVYFGFTLSCTIIYSPLLFKTNRIYRVFSAGRKGIQKVKGVSSFTQLLFSTLVILIQVGITISSTLVQYPEPRLRMRQRMERHVELMCHLPLETLLPPLSFNLLLLLLCAYYGFLTRRLPENFNESWYIFVSVSTTMFLWMVFLPSYFTAFRAYHQVVLMTSCLVLNGYITMLCMYVTKIYALFMVDQQSLTFQPTEVTQSTINSSQVEPAPQVTDHDTIQEPETGNM